MENMENMENMEKRRREEGHHVGVGGLRYRATTLDDHPCLECLHDLLAATKRFRGSATLPTELHWSIAQQCSKVKDKLSSPGHSKEGGVLLKDVLCPKHCGLINDKLGFDLLRLCFQYLSYDDLCRAACVCQLWNKVASLDGLWDSLLQQLPYSNFISPPTQVFLQDSQQPSGSQKISSKLKYMLYSKGAQWDEGFSGKYTIDTAFSPTMESEAMQSVVEFQDKKKTVLVSSGSKMYQLVSPGSHFAGGGAGIAQDRWRSMMKVYPSLSKGGGRWTVNLKRLSRDAVNAIGLAAELNGKALAWLFNTDGSDSPIKETNVSNTKIKIFSWHGFGDVVTPNFWRIVFNMDEDKLLLDCGMRNLTQLGCPLVQKEGLIQGLLSEMNDANDCKTEITDTSGMKCYLVLLLQDTKATMVDLCDL